MTCLHYKTLLQCSVIVVVFLWIGFVSYDAWCRLYIPLMCLLPDGCYIGDGMPAVQ